MNEYKLNTSTIIKCIRKVLNTLNEKHVDSGMRAAFLMKRYVSNYEFEEEAKPKLALLCFLKDIGDFYQTEDNYDNDPAKAAASSYTFLKHCSPLGDAAKPLLFYKSKYIDSLEDENYYYGMLISLIDDVIYLAEGEYTAKEIIKKLNEKKDNYDPYQLKTMGELLLKEPDILEKLSSDNSLFIYEASSFIQNAPYTIAELIGFIDMLIFSIEFHSHETLAHTVTTAEIAKEIAKHARFSPAQIEAVYYAALLLDIGKIKVPVDLLAYPGRMTEDETRMMQNHVIYSKEILEGCFPYDIINMVLHHHERLDGSGYPHQLRELSLTTGDRIVALSDFISTLYCRRIYKDSLDKDMIVNEVDFEANEGRFDRRIADHFIDNFDEIMQLAYAREQETLSRYKRMKEEYAVLADSDALKKFFY